MSYFVSEKFNGRRGSEVKLITSIQHKRPVYLTEGGAEICPDMRRYSPEKAFNIVSDVEEHALCFSLWARIIITVRNPRTSRILYRKGPTPAKKGQPEDSVYYLEDNINVAVFPSLHGGPNDHQIGVFAVALGLKAYVKQVKDNAITLGDYLIGSRYKLVTGRTENHHLVLRDFCLLGLAGNKAEKPCDLCNITVKKNALSCGSRTLAPGVTRIGGYGTLKELPEVINCIQLGFGDKPVALLNGCYIYFLTFIDNEAIEDGFIGPSKGHSIVSAPNPKELVQKLEDYVPVQDGLLIKQAGKLS